MRQLAALLALALLLTSAPAWAARSNVPPPAGTAARGSKIELPSVETNVNLGKPSITDDGDFPQGRNNKRQLGEGERSLIPTLSQYICVGADCSCGSR